jgi:SH3-like domain-containing protein
MRSRFDARKLERMAEFQKAEDLLRQGTREFKAYNYGGALYLAVQSKNQADTCKRIIQNRDARMPSIGEVVFDQPLPLVLTKNTNLRKGPDATFPIVRTLKQGTAVVGYSHNGTWIRVAVSNGLAGWVHQSLVNAR